MACETVEIKLTCIRFPLIPSVGYRIATHVLDSCKIIICYGADSTCPLALLLLTWACEAEITYTLTWPYPLKVC